MPAPRLSLAMSPLAYRADLLFYGLLLAGLLLSLLWSPSALPGPALVALGLTGLALWTLIEYLTHRYVLHGLQPFRRWHALHHGQPQQCMGLPTWASAALFAILVYAPLLAWAGPGIAAALMAGVLAGYLLYSVTHQGIHQDGDPDRDPAASRGLWLERRRRWHALHHEGTLARCYGVTTTFWDRALGSHLRPGSSARRRAPAHRPSNPAAPGLGAHSFISKDNRS